MSSIRFYVPCSPSPPRPPHLSQPLPTLWIIGKDTDEEPGPWAPLFEVF